VEMEGMQSCSGSSAPVHAASREDVTNPQACSSARQELGVDVGETPCALVNRVRGVVDVTGAGKRCKSSARERRTARGVQ